MDRVRFFQHLSRDLVSDIRELHEAEEIVRSLFQGHSYRLVHFSKLAEVSGQFPVVRVSVQTPDVETASITVVCSTVVGLDSGRFSSRRQK